MREKLTRSYLPVAVPGLIFIFIGIIVTGLLFYFEWAVVAWLFLLITCFICWFFRDPERFITTKQGALVSPADGKVIVIEKVNKGEYVDTEALKISIFMNVFNVHVNRVPFDGIVQEVKYTPGKFFNASFDKASEFNERSALTIKTSQGYTYKVVQIAGLIARRIVCQVKENTFLRRGDRYGMIRFGSRLDLYLPCDTKVVTAIGQKVKAGSSILGFLKKEEA